MKKKMSIFGLALLMLSGSMLFAGGGRGDQHAAGGAVAAGYSDFVTPVGEFPIVKAPFTMRVFAIQHATIENLLTNELTLSYERKTGVRINWEIAPAAAGTERRNLSLISGDFPDVYLASGITREDEVVYGPQGAFIPLNNLIELYNPNVLESFAELPYVRPMITAPDGNLYSLPNMSTAIHTQYPVKLWMNSTWLRNLNLRPPATTEEFSQVLTAFRDRDPNGNNTGRQVIPFFAADNRTSHFVTFIMNSFIQCDRDFMYATNDGRLQFAFDKPEWREGLRYIRRLVSERLIDETSFGASNDQLRRVAENPGTMILGSTIQLSPSSFMDMNGERHRNYDTIAPLTGPRNVRYAIYNPAAFFSTGQFVVTRAMRHPEVAMRWIDYFYLWEGALEARIGQEGVHWFRAQPGTLSYAGLPARWGRITAIGGAQNIFWSQWNMAQFNRHDRQISGDDIYAVDGLEKRLFEATNNFYIPYMPPNPIPPLFIAPDTIRRINQPLNDIRNYVQESIVGFATGSLDLDRDWDAYVNNIQRMGAANVLNAYQDAYNSYLRNR